MVSQRSNNSQAVIYNEVEGRGQHQSIELGNQTYRRGQKQERDTQQGGKKDERQNCILYPPPIIKGIV